MSKVTVKPGRLPSATGAISRLAFARAQDAGIALDAILEQAGVTPSQLSDPEARIPVRDQIRFVNLIAEAVDDDLLGFHLALASEMREVGLLFYVLASSDTLGKALRRAGRYTSIVNEGVGLQCTEGEDLVVAIRYVGVRRLLDRQQILYWITAVLRICRMLAGRDLTPRSVCLAHRRPPSDELTRFFGCPVEFGSGDELVFPGDFASLPIVSADPHLNKLLVSYCEEALAGNTRNRGEFRSKVENVIAPLLPHGNIQADAVARHLGISQRTLARHLSLHGMTFSALMDELRSDLAHHYLSDGNLSVSETAWLLGYREVASFSRAFKRWTGKRPREARSSLIKQ
jgi:AraC-like DNA-binding protein